MARNFGQLLLVDVSEGSSLKCLSLSFVFSNQPQLVSFTKKIGSLFTAPKVRESFMRSFVDCDSVDGANRYVCDISLCVTCHASI